MTSTTIRNVFSTIVGFAKKRKIVSLAIVAVLSWGGYSWFWSGDGVMQTTYVLGTVEKGTIISTVAGSGQVSALSQVDINPKASGDITAVLVSNGDMVKAGQAIAYIDSSDAQKSVRDAKISLESALISLEKLKEPAEELTVYQAENAIEQANADLEKAYDDGFTAVSNAFLDLPTVMSGLEDVLYGTNVNSSGQVNIDAYNDLAYRYNEDVVIFKQDAETKYKAAREAYNETFLAYRSLTRTSSDQEIEDLVIETYDTVKIIADAVKSANDLLGFIEDELDGHSITMPQALTIHQNTLSDGISETNANLSSLLNIKDSITSSQYTITVKEKTLEDLNADVDELDLRSTELSVQQRRNSLADAQEKLADYVVRAPFAGTLTGLDVKKGDAVSTGSSLATLMTDEKVAEITLNEVDVAKVEVGQKATLTLDALEDLSITGEVADVDAVGEVSQGVVSYTVKIRFDTQDERILPGMSISATIITDVRQNVLTLESGAIKMSDDGESYVEVPSETVSATSTIGTAVVLNAPLSQRVVVTGLSDDTLVEIISGLDEGDIVVVRTSSQSASGGSTSGSNSNTTRQGTGSGPGMMGVFGG